MHGIIEIYTETEPERAINRDTQREKVGETYRQLESRMGRYVDAAAIDRMKRSADDPAADNQCASPTDTYLTRLSAARIDPSVDTCSLVAAAGDAASDRRVGSGGGCCDSREPRTLETQTTEVELKSSSSDTNLVCVLISVARGRSGGPSNSLEIDVIHCLHRFPHLVSSSI